MAIIDYCNPGN
ncbi:uncharacterized protein FFE2_16084 [Fusarium fujikuroi]|nr:uncharacterized protein FFE2_16084 [Fusarium fujikuroi]